MDLVWLASYPKSGNTWLRFFLYCYLYGAPRDSAQILRKLPDIHVSNPDQSATGRVFCKTHLMYSPAHPFASQTTAFIYIIRHPKDVLLSSLNYFRLIKKTQSGDTVFAREFIDHMGVPLWRSNGIGSWSEHVASWQDSGLPHLMLRYEDLRRDPHAEFRRVIEFLGLELDQARLNLGVHLASFDKMKAFEDKEVHRGRSSLFFPGAPAAKQDGYRFMNRGACGQSLAHVDPDLDVYFNKRFRDVLKQFGYPAEAPVHEASQ